MSKERIKKLWHKKKVVVITFFLSILLFSVSVFIFLRNRSSTNTDIIMLDSSKNWIFSNQNPNFGVDFGVRDDSSKQIVRFRSKTTLSNPFDSKPKTLLKKIVDIFTPQKEYTIEMSLEGVELGDVELLGDSVQKEKVLSVAEVVGESDIKTTTQLVDMGRVLGEEDSKQPVSRKTVVNKNVARGVDIEYQILEGKGVKEEIVINSLSEYTKECSDVSQCSIPLNKFSFSLKLDEGVNLKKGWFTIDGRSKESYYFEDERGRYLGHILPSFALDSAGVKTYDVSLVIDEREGGEYILTVTVPIDWLLSADRVFPVRVDPSIVHDTSTQFNTGTYMGTRYETLNEIGMSNRSVSFSKTDSSVVGLWNMNETMVDTCGGGADLCDGSGNGYHATITGGVTPVGSPEQYGWDFDGATGSRADVGDLTAFEIPSFTIEAYFKKEGTSTYNHNTIISKGSSGSQGFNFAVLGTTPVLHFRINDTGSDGQQFVSGTTVIENNVWYHAAVTVDGTSKMMTLYLNGKYEASKAYTAASITHGTAGVKIGNANDNNDLGFNGVIGAIRYSNVVRDYTYIRENFTNYSSGVYQSPIMDIGGGGDISLSYQTTGVKTVNGETPYSTTGLVAQWNLNEVSGTVATNNGGSCGSACNGTLTNFASTTVQDGGVLSGWTSINRRWGSGALMFDGVDDRVSVPDNAAFNFDYNQDFSISSWFKISTLKTTEQDLIFKFDGGVARYPFRISINPDGTLAARRWDGTNQAGIISNGPFVSDGKYHYMVFSKLGSVLSLYLDGELYATATDTTTNTVNTSPLCFGDRCNSSYSFGGVLDSISIYNRALTPLEVASNYNSGKIEFQVRGGNSLDPNDGTWSSWSNAGGESVLESYDNPYMYKPNESGLVSYWSMDELSGSTVGDVKGVNNGTATGTTVTNGVFGKGRNFNGTSDYVTIPNSTSLNINGSGSQLSISMWFNAAVVSGTQAVLYKNNGGVDNNQTSYSDRQYCIFITATGFVGIRSTSVNNVGVGQTSLNSTIPVIANVWNHIGVVIDSVSGIMRVYLNGKDAGSVPYSTTGIRSATGNILLGKTTATAASFYSGLVDEVKIYNTVLTGAQMFSNYLSGLEKKEVFRQNSSVLGMEEGSTSYSKKLEYVLDTGLVNHWKLDEVSGNTAYDSVRTDNGTVTGTTVVSGKYGAARSFNGTSDDITVLSNLGITNGNITMSAWIKPTNATSSAGHPAIISHYDDSAKVDYRLFQYTTGIGAARHAPNVSWNETTQKAVTAGEWYHVALVYSAPTLSFYLNGVLHNSISATSAGSGTYITETVIGKGSHSSAYFAGVIDDVRVYNVAKTAEEIQEEYYSSGIYHTNYPVVSTDFSGKSSFPFYFAGDRVGTYTSAILGESAYGNRQVDSNTVALWRMDEPGGTTVSSSTGSNNGSVVGTTIVDGKFGLARNFNGSSDYVAANVTSLPVGSSARSVSAWFKTTSTPKNYNTVFSYGTATSGRVIYMVTLRADGRAYFESGSGGDPIYSKNSLNDGRWHLVALTYNGSILSMYVDGMFQGSITATLATASSAFHIGNMVWDANYKFTGAIDEVRISNVARSAEEIRQAYEVGLRSHNITVDFGAELQSSNLITGSTDLTFSIDGTKVGMPQMASNLYAGDRIIVREVVGGVEYLAQGKVKSVNALTGAVEVYSWDSISTFPTGGYTVKSSVFKWQREYIQTKDRTIPTDMDAVNLLTIQLTNTYGGRNVWIDDLRSNDGYISSSPTAVDLGAEYKYIQYRSIISSTDRMYTPYLNQVQIDFTSRDPRMEELMRHGKWFNVGQKQPFWWVR